MANEIMKRNEAFLIYQDENGIARVNVRFEGEDVWLPVEQIMELFDASQQDVSYHINQIYAEGELDPERTHKKYLLVRQEGARSVHRHISRFSPPCRTNCTMPLISIRPQRSSMSVWMPKSLW